MSSPSKNIDKPNIQLDKSAIDIKPINKQSTLSDKHAHRTAKPADNCKTNAKYILFALVPIIVALVASLIYRQQSAHQFFPSSNKETTASTSGLLATSLPDDSIQEKRDSFAVPNAEICIQVDEKGNIKDPKSVIATLGYLPGPVSHSLNVTKNSKVATFAAGCFWGVEYLFRKHYGSVPPQENTLLSSMGDDLTISKGGLIDTRVGYSGGYWNSTLPTYKQVCTNTTNHAEVVQLSYNPALVSYADLVDFFFRIHDPTTLDEQGPRNFGAQYRSAIFTHDDAQYKIAQRIKNKYQKKWYQPINKTVVTKIEPIKIFWDAEDYHQTYFDNNENGRRCPSHFVRTSAPKK